MTAKRIMDVVVSVLMLVILAPFLAILSLIIRLFLGSPVLFKQVRPGLAGKPFTLFKFRTMTDRRDEKGDLLPDAERLTPLGQWLRSTSLDELPELFNVIRGDMSLVGPRPLLMEYLPLYSHYQARRHEILPGITGWAQINGRNAISWEEKFDLDIWYVDNRSLMLDLKILYLTAATALRREGINQPGAATAEKFTGSVKEESASKSNQNEGITHGQ
jgi:lipopolysaccharide/colanic/teichoic acid biosynthesis glycosyltransferase